MLKVKTMIISLVKVLPLLGFVYKICLFFHDENNLQGVLSSFICEYIICMFFFGTALFMIHVVS